MSIRKPVKTEEELKEEILEKRRRLKEKRGTPEEQAKAKAYHQAYYEKVRNSKEYKAKSLAQKQRWTKNHREYARRQATVYRQENMAKRLFLLAKARAKRLNIPFDIEESDVVIPKYCPLLGMELTMTQGKGRVGSNASLDKIDPSLGYVKGNIQVISSKANIMKQDATAEMLVTFATNVLFLHGQSLFSEVA